MKNYIIALCLLFCITSCNDSKKEEDTETSYGQDDPIELKKSEGSTETTKTENSKDSVNEEKNIEEDLKTTISGTYINNEHQEDQNCNCYCLDVRLNGTSQLCLTEDKLYIQGRFEKNGEDINLYYSGKSSGNNDTEIPWDSFETGTPIAVLSPTSDGFELDWKGFSIDGEIAIDYALLGKKTLEGTYKRK